MAFLDDIDRKILKLGQDALQKTKDVSESVKLAASVREEESLQRDCFCKIGELFYDNCKDQAEGEYQELFAEIEESRKRAADLKEQLHALKKITVCSSCGAENPLNAVYCNSCGAKIDQVAADVPYQEVD